MGTLRHGAGGVNWSNGMMGEAIVEGEEILGRVSARGGVVGGRRSFIHIVQPRIRRAAAAAAKKEKKVKNEGLRLRYKNGRESPLAIITNHATDDVAPSTLHELTTLSSSLTTQSCQ